MADTPPLPPGITTAELAAAAGVTTRTIRKYTRLKIIAGTMQGRGLVFDKAASLSSISRYTGDVQGGKRTGSGRKTATVSPNDTFVSQTLPSVSPVSPIVPIGAPPGQDQKTVEPEPLELETSEGISKSLRGMAMTEASRIRAVARAATDQLRLNQTRGLLVDVREAEAAVGAAFSTAQASMLELPERLTVELGADLGLDEAKSTLVREWLARSIGALLDRLANDPLGLGESGQRAA